MCDVCRILKVTPDGQFVGVNVPPSAGVALDKRFGHERAYIYREVHDGEEVRSVFVVDIEYCPFCGERLINVKS